MWHQVLGLVAVTLTAAVLLRGWEAPGWAVGAFCILALAGTVLFALAGVGRRVEPEPQPYRSYSEQATPQASHDAGWTKPREGPASARPISPVKRPAP